MARKYREYADADVIKHAAGVKSIAGLLRALGLKPLGGNYRTAHDAIVRLNIDTSHWTGKLWSKGRQLKRIGEFKRAKNAKPHLIKIRGHKCEKCQLTLWLELPIPLEIHHKDGDNNNNTEENLELLCPNCHSQTPNFRVRKSRRAGTGYTEKS